MRRALGRAPVCCRAHVSIGYMASPHPPPLPASQRTERPKAYEIGESLKEFHLGTWGIAESGICGRPPKSATSGGGVSENALRGTLLENTVQISGHRGEVCLSVCFLFNNLSPVDSFLGKSPSKHAESPNLQSSLKVHPPKKKNTGHCKETWNCYSTRGLTLTEVAKLKNAQRRLNLKTRSVSHFLPPAPPPPKQKQTEPRGPDPSSSANMWCLSDIWLT